MAGAKTLRKFKSAVGALSAVKEKAKEERLAANATLRRNPDATLQLSRAQNLEKKYQGQMKKAQALANAAGREIGLDINRQIVSRRKDAKRRGFMEPIPRDPRL